MCGAFRIFLVLKISHVLEACITRIYTWIAWMTRKIWMACLLCYVSQEESRAGDTAEIAAMRSRVYKASKFPSCERNGVDQGIHNLLVHHNLVPNIKVWSQANGPVANMQAKVAIIRVLLFCHLFCLLHVWRLKFVWMSQWFSGRYLCMYVCMSVCMYICMYVGPEDLKFMYLCM